LQLVNTVTKLTEQQLRPRACSSLYKLHLSLIDSVSDYWQFVLHAVTAWHSLQPVFFFVTIHSKLCYSM